MKTNKITLSPKDIIRLWSKIQTGPLKNCWPWLAGTDNAGYGRINIAGKNRKASRVVYTLVYGHTPLFVCHACDNPLCCNPAHLWAGTVTDNNQDAKVKGRTISIERTSIVTPQIARDIANRKQAGQSAREITKALNLKLSTVRGIYYGNRWNHITKIRVDK